MMWVPELSSDRSIEGAAERENSTRAVLSAIASGKWDLMTALERQLAAQNFNAAERVIERMRDSAEYVHQLAESERKSFDLLSDGRKALLARIEGVRAQIERAITSNLLRETERGEMESVIFGVEDTRKTIKDLRPAFEALKRVEAQIGSLRSRQKKTILDRLNTKVPKDRPEYDRILALIDTEDFATADDYIGYMEQGQKLPARENVVSAFEDFFPETADRILHYLEGQSAIQVAKAIRNREDLAGMSLKGVTGAHAERFATAVEKWFEMKRAQKAETEKIMLLLNALGFLSVHELQPFQKSGQTWFSFKTDVISDRERCPIAHYGSDAEGSYRLLCLFERYDESQIVDFAEETFGQSPLIVFFFARLTDIRRRNLSRSAIDRRRTFVILDDILLLYLSKSETVTKNFFECSLPFTYAEPYVTTAGLVPRELFFGRRRELESVLSLQGSCFIYGGRQLGKTALLREAARMFHDPNEGRIAIWIDLKTRRVGHSRSIDDAWPIVAGELVSYGIVAQKNIANMRLDRLLESIRVWIDQNKSRRMLLLLDEADDFLRIDGARSEDEGRSEEFSRSAKLKSLMDLTGRRFKVVFAGLHNVQRTTRLANHPLAHYGEPLCIGLLRRYGMEGSREACTDTPGIYWLQDP